MGLDVALFRLINQTSANALGDALLPWLTRGGVVQNILVGSGIALVVWAYLRGDRADVSQAWRVVLVAVLAVVVCELIGSRLLKAVVGRPRPPLTLPDVRLLIGLGHSLSFPSGHALNTAAVAGAMAHGFRRPGWVLLGFAAVIAYSRVYVGVHYPLDVVGGGLFGLGMADLMWRASERWPVWRRTATT